MVQYLIDELVIEDFSAEEEFPFKNVFGGKVKLLGKRAMTDKGKEFVAIVLEITGLDEDKDKKQISNLTSLIITSFRLASVGGMGYSKKSNGEPIYGLPYRPPEGVIDPYKIKKVDLGEVERRAIDIHSIPEMEKDDSILKFALSRFNRSYDEINQEDILLDLAICLEVLAVMNRCNLCGEFSGTKITLINNHLTPIILEDLLVEKMKEIKETDLKQRQQRENKLRDKIESEVHSNLKKAYNFRDAIVHQGIHIYDGITIPDGTNTLEIPKVWAFLQMIRKYARIVLLHYIKALKKYPTLKTEYIVLSKYIKEDQQVVTTLKIIKEKMFPDMT